LFTSGSYFENYWSSPPFRKIFDVKDYVFLQLLAFTINVQIGLHFFTNSSGHPDGRHLGANPTITSYNASVVITYSATT
jgi:hypothetical protein